MSSSGGAAAQASHTSQQANGQDTVRPLDVIIAERVATLAPRSRSASISTSVKRKKASIIVDTSGSTANTFGGTGCSVLTKELNIARCIIELLWDTHSIEIIPFGSTASRMDLLVEGLDRVPLYDLPQFSSSGGTYTHLAISLVKNATICFIITDGETSSGDLQLKAAVKPLIDYGTTVHIISVSCRPINFQALPEGQVPHGMDLLGSIGETVAKVEIYTPEEQYRDAPFLLAQSNTMKGDTIPFGTHLIPKGMYITDLTKFLLGILEQPFSCTPADYLKFVMRCTNLVGRFDSSLTKQKVSTFSTNLLQKLYQHKPPCVEDKDILRFAIHGIRALANQFVDNTNLEKRVAASNTEAKQLSFKDTDAYLRTHGTAAERPVIDFLSTCGVFASAEAGILEVTQAVGNFPNSKTANGLYAIGHGIDAQPARQGLRAMFKDYGMTDADKGPLVSGAIALMMLQHLLLGQPIDSEHMQTLTRLMKQQQGMDVILVKGKTPAEDVRSGPICEEWKAGRNPPINPTTPDVRHIELYGDGGLNPFKVNPTFYWAVFMSLHQDAELFNAQLHIYGAILELLGVGKTWQEVLTYFVNQYKDYVSGTSEMMVVERPAECIINFTTFEDKEPCFQIMDHKTPDGVDCTYGSYIGAEEQPTLQGCPWCHKPVWQLRLERQNYKRPITLLNEKVQAAKPFVIRVPHHLPCMIPDCVLPNGPFTWSSCKPAATAGGGAAAITEPQPVVPRAAAGGGAAVVSAPVPVNSSIPMYAVFMIGSVGSGKSSAREVMVRELESRKWVVTVVNMDAISKRGQQKQANAIIQKAVADGKNLAKSKNVPYVVIFDLCNEKWQPSNPDCFGIKIRGNYTCVPFMVNFDPPKDPEGYRAWSLLNVVNRPPASDADHFWLNPREATLQTCIKVSNDKIASMFATRGIPAIAALDTTMSEGALRARLQPDAERYAKTLLPVEEVVRKFIKDNKIGE